MRERTWERRPVSRRDFLRRAGTASLALPSMVTILTACGESGNASGVNETSGELPLARPDHPVKLPITEDNPPVEDNLEPEAGPIRLYGFVDYIWKKVLNRFTDEFGADFEYTAFDTPEEMIAKLQAQGSTFDLLVGVGIYDVAKLSLGKLVQPLNHGYLSNFEANAWPAVKNPFYDQGSQYSVPYTVFSTGFAYRNDLVKEDLSRLENPYDALWNTQYSGQVNLLNGARDTLSAGQLRAGIDVNTTDPTDLETVSNMLLDGVRAMNWKFDNTDYNELNDEFVIHQTWSGQPTYYQSYLPKGMSIEQFSWVWPPTTPSKRPGLIENDCLAIPRGCKHPVLAHSLINFLYQPDIALENYTYEGYQPPIKQYDPDKAVSDGIVPENLRNSLLSEADYPLGSDPIKVTLLELPPQVNQRYQQIYEQVTGGV